MNVKLVITALTTFFKLIGRGLDKLDEHDKLRKQLQREERRASVRKDPDKVFSGMFGESDNEQLYNSNIDQPNCKNVRSDLPTITVDKNGKRTGNDT